MEGMVDDSSYLARGKSSMMNCAMNASRQRSCKHRASKATTTFQSPAKRAMVLQAKQWIGEQSDLEPPQNMTAIVPPHEPRPACLPRAPMARASVRRV